MAVIALAVFAAVAVPVPARPDPSACKNVITGTALPESLDGTPQNDRILGLGGDDRLAGAAGDDCLNGGFDSDQLLGAAGDDRLEGSNGEDSLAGDAGADDLMGEQDADRLDGGGGADRLWGGGARDTIRGGAGGDVLRGQGGDDYLYGGAGADKPRGGAGDDTITEVPGVYSPTEPLGTGRNQVVGGGGRDRVNVANGRRDRVNCGSGTDTVKADKGDRLHQLREAALPDRSVSGRVAREGRADACVHGQVPVDRAGGTEPRLLLDLGEGAARLRVARAHVGWRRVSRRPCRARAVAAVQGQGQESQALVPGHVPRERRVHATGCQGHANRAVRLPGPGVGELAVGKWRTPADRSPSAKKSPRSTSMS